MESLTLSGDSFVSFLKVAGVLKEYCNDMCVVDGIVRQRSNDRSCIFEFDLTSVFGNRTVLISALKNVCPMLEVLPEAMSDIEVKITEREIFVGKKGIVIFRRIMPDPSLLDNKFIPEEELSKLFVLSQDDILVSFQITPMLSKIIRVSSQQYNVSTVKVNFLGEEATLQLNSQSRDGDAELSAPAVTNKPVKGSTSLVVFPFIIEYDESITLEIYRVEKTICMNKFVTSVGDIPAIIYSRSPFKEEE